MKVKSMLYESSQTKKLIDKPLNIYRTISERLDARKWFLSQCGEHVPRVADDEPVEEDQHHQPAHVGHQALLQREEVSGIEVVCYS